MINVIDEDGTILQFSIQIGSASQLLAELKTEQSTLTFSVFPLQHSIVECVQLFKGGHGLKSGAGLARMQ